MMTKISFAGTTLVAVAITCARIGLPPTSCRTLGCRDFSRVPLPAAMIAMATRGCRTFNGNDFLAGGFAIVDMPEVVTGLHIHPQLGGRKGLCMHFVYNTLCAQSLYTHRGRV